MVKGFFIPGGWQPGLPLVALSAVTGKYAGVNDGFSVAGGAVRGGYGKCLGVTLLAGSPGMTLIQREARGRVVKILSGKLYHFEFPPAMVWMAGTAFQRVLHIAVYPGPAGHLFVNVQVAFSTERSLVGTQGLVAKPALILKIGMRAVNTDRGTKG